MEAGGVQDVIVCRCEGIAWSDVQAAIDTFQPGSLRQLKLLTRWGMGMCQGRMCRPFAAAWADRPDSGNPRAIGAQTPLRPMTLGELGEGE